ncbi:unnamed protein product [Rhizoctonia solani]|uniref:F-box domain-containing protein n=1 Tax=Rhizoctonia solani TaxID=456999 RepID=A0A8H3E572_9AGAM|nr:unnamed protein product [Rhizoctonia solani]
MPEFAALPATAPLDGSSARSMDIPIHSTPNSSLRVFEIYELVVLICELLSRRDNASLLCVCHQLSRVVRPFVWERIDTVEPLVRMIPGTCVDVYGDEPFRPFITMSLPKSLDLARLSFYAPYIKYLDIPLTTTIDAYENWDQFLASTRTTDLLPNLQHLKLIFTWRTNEETIIGDTLKWVTAFLSSSLLSLEIYPDFGWNASIHRFGHAFIGLDRATQLLHALSEKCSRLSSLAILPGDITTHSSMWLDTTTYGAGAEVVPASAIFHKEHIRLDLIFPRFEYLRDLSATPSILESRVFRALGDLAYLETLSIRGFPITDLQGNCYKVASNLELTAHSFPALRHLDLLNLHYKVVINICRHKPLARALRRLRPINWWSTGRQRHTELLDSLIEHDSAIDQLDLFHLLPRWFITPRFLRCLSYLQLTHLSIPQPVHRRFEYDWNELARAVPVLKSLELTEWITYEPLEFERLWDIAIALPNLSHLSGCFQYWKTSSPDEFQHDFFPQSLEPFCLELSLHRNFGRRSVDLDRTARLLGTLSGRNQ